MVRSKRLRARDGKDWLIRRRWASKPKWGGLRGIWRRRPRPASKRGGAFFGFLTPFDAGGFDGIAALFIVAGVILFVVFMIFFGIPLLIFLIDTLLIIPAVAIGGVLGRVFLGRPWTLEASTAGPPPQSVEWHVVGWGASDRAAAQMAGMLKATSAVPHDPVLESRHRRRRARR